MQIYRHCCCKICVEVVSFSRPVMRNHDIASSSSVTHFYLYFYMFFILVYETAKWYKSSDGQKTVSSLILGISILRNGVAKYKAWFIRREIKMTPVINRLIWYYNCHQELQNRSSR